MLLAKLDLCTDNAVTVITMQGNNPKALGTDKDVFLSFVAMGFNNPRTYAKST